MPLPANPSNGQTALLNGISYVYDGAKGTWRRQATSITVSDFVVQGNLTLASNVESTSSSTGALVISGGLGVSGSVYSGGIYTNSLFYSNGSPYTVGGAGGGSSVPKITNIQVTDSSYVVLDDTAVDTAGGYIKITGTDFVSGCTVLIGSTPASSVTFVSSTEVRAQVPATSAGTYVVYLVNPDGGVAIRVNGITFSGFPSWVTSSTLNSVTVGNEINIQLNASGASIYALAAGSTLPAGLTLSNVGLLSGTVTGLENDTTYNFTVVATDAELQDSPRAFSITIGINDEFFPYVSLLLDGEGTDGSQNNTFQDSSTNNFTITRNGNTTQGSFSPYGANWSNYFDGNLDYLSIPSNASWQFGSGDFTIEAWVYINARGSSGSVFAGTWGASNRGWIWVSTPTVFNFTYSTNGTNETAVSATYTIPLNTWTHLASVRSGNTVTQYANGVAVGSGSVTGVSINASTQPLYIGHNKQDVDNNINNFAMNGYISNLRIVSTALYTSNFTPPTSPLTAVAGTILLTCQSNRLIDNSTNNFAITRNGNVAVTKFSPFSPTLPYSTTNNGGSGFFDNTGDYLTVPANVALAMGSGAFTMEAWVYNVGGFATDPIFESRSSSTSAAGYAFLINSSGYLNVYTNSTFVGQSSTALVPGIWHHVALVRTGTGSNQTTYYINGVASGTITLSGNFTDASSSVTTIGGSTTPGENFSGYISNARIVKGTAVYTSNFTPPTAPLTAVSGTSLLLNFTNAGVVDRSQQNIIETVGNAGISTAVKKYGSSSMYFDGNGDWLQLPVTQNLNFGLSNFTIEGWINVASIDATYRCIFSIGNPVQIYARGGTIEVYFNDSDDISSYIVYQLLGPANSITANTWAHFAVVRNGTTFTAYVNGVAGTPATGVSGAIAFSATGAQIGAISNTYSFTGYIDDLRITKGYARYTANFTPPTGPHNLK